VKGGGSEPRVASAAIDGLRPRRGADVRAGRWGGSECIERNLDPNDEADKILEVLKEQ